MKKYTFITSILSYLTEKKGDTLIRINRKVNLSSRDWVELGVD